VNLWVLFSECYFVELYIHVTVLYVYRLSQYMLHIMFKLRTDEIISERIVCCCFGENNIKMNVKEITRDGVDWIYLA